MTVNIITDSAADLPRDVIDRYNIDVVPFLIRLKEEVFHDGVDITSEEVYQGMKEGKMYKTAQIPPATFREKFYEYAEEQGSYIYLAFSSELSGTYQTAVLVKEQLQQDYPDFDLDIVDTESASLGFGLIVEKAASMAAAGANKKEILQAVAFYKEHIEHIFTVDDLEYLFRGGRINKTSAVVGGLLNIKPILEVNEGKLEPLQKVRGGRKVKKRMLEIMEERGVRLSEQIIGISHSDDKKGAMLLKEKIEEKFGSQEFIINMIGGVIGAHVGPGTLSIFFLNEIYE